MSRAPPENADIAKADRGPGPGTHYSLPLGSISLCSLVTFPAGDHQYPPESVPTHGPKTMSNFVDGSGPIFSMYLEVATEEDKKMAEGWKADADGILIFVSCYLLLPFATLT